ncbi:hypothetical protein, partial [Kingella kingae]|uniref:hypothetical protein n=1 Tax=Kingella kingae TaxID=504 RepID=UPI001E3C11B7
ERCVEQQVQPVQAALLAFPPRGLNNQPLDVGLASILPTGFATFLQAVLRYVLAGGAIIWAV